MLSVSDAHIGNTSRKMKSNRSTIALKLWWIWRGNYQTCSFNARCNIKSTSVCIIFMWIEQTSTFTHFPDMFQTRAEYKNLMNLRLHDVKLKPRIVQLRHLQCMRLIGTQNHSLSIFAAVLHQINISFASQTFRFDNIVWTLFMVIVKSLLQSHNSKHEQKRGHSLNGSVKVFYSSPFQTLKRANRYSP